MVGLFLGGCPVARQGADGVEAQTGGVIHQMEGRYTGGPILEERGRSVSGAMYRTKGR